MGEKKNEQAKVGGRGSGRTHEYKQERAVMLTVYAAWAEGQMLCEKEATTPLPEEVNEIGGSLRTVAPIVNLIVNLLCGFEVMDVPYVS
jgi:hypothetical protein